MLRKLKYSQIAKLKLDVYVPRTDRHPQYATNALHIVPKQTRINPVLLVLLSAHSNHLLLEGAVQKIFDGMLSVVNLPPTQIMTAVIQEFVQEPILLQIAQWQPKFILQLDMEMPLLNIANCVQTFSPSYLLANPKFKAEAYKKLLFLRDMLHGASNRNS